MKRLQLSFKCEDGKPYSMSVQDPKEGLTAEEVKNALKTIVEKSLLVNKNDSKVMLLVGAKNVETKTEELF